MMNKEVLKAYSEGPWKLNGLFWEAPCTLMVQGVHAGSHGPIFWAAHILRQNARKWEGVPLALGHPYGPDGKPVSINASPEIRAAYEIGRVTRPYYDEAKKGIRAVIQVRQGHPKLAEIKKLREVSVGIFSDQTETYGQWNGEEYHACAINMTPDHLAALPEGQIGACSWADSCGIRTNTRGGYTMHDYTSEANYPPEALQALQEKDDLQALARWENHPGPYPPEILELRRKYANRYQGQEQPEGQFAHEANIPPVI